MGNYSEEILKLGNLTLEKFLLLLKEDVKLRTQKSKNLNKNIFTHNKAVEKYNIPTGKNKITNQDDFYIEREGFFEINNLFQEHKKLSESQYLASNAYFIYLFAIFDQFLLSVTENVLRNNQEMMINYKNYCLNHYEKTKDKTLFKVLPFEEKLIEFLPNLSSPISISSKILNIDFKDNAFILHYFNLVEMRERRNLLVHRSGIGDETYSKTIKSHLSSFPQKQRNKFLQTIEKNIERNLRIEPEYFIESIKTLYFFVCIIANYSIEKNSGNENKINLFTEPFHDLLINTLENKPADMLLTIPIELLTIFEEKDLEGNLNLMDDIAKVNWILLNEALKEKRIKIYENFKEAGRLEENLTEEDLKLIEETDQLMQETRDLVNKKNKDIIEHINDKDTYEIISSFLERNYSSYLLCLKKFIDNIEKVNVEEWYMHKKLSEDIKFREMYADFKNKHKLDSKKVKFYSKKK